MKIWFLFIFVSLQLYAQGGNADANDNAISYVEQPTLTWEFFKGNIPIATDFAASVNTGVGLKWSYSTAGGVIDFRYEVEAYVEPDFSWVKEKEKDAELLKHEQLHFDISELHARMLRKRIGAYKFGRDIRRPINKLLNTVLQEREIMQKAYDDESEHSKNKEQQLIWEQKIAQLMEAHKEFAIN